MRPPLVFALMCVAPVLLAACDRAPPVDGLKEWKPEDHDGERRIGAGKQAPKGDAGGIPMLVEVAWKNQCQSCHGPEGRGDGPQGPMFKAADLGREEWQAKVSDGEIATVILNGRGRMPKFELPEPIVVGLVGRVRSFRAPK